MKSIRIDQIGEIITGNTPPRKNKYYFGEDYTWIKPTDIILNRRYVSHTEEKFSHEAFVKYKNSLIPPQSTCVVTIGSIGNKICLTNENCFTNQAINSVIPDKSNFNPKFIYYLLKYNLPQLTKRNLGTTSGRENISKSDFSNISVKVPDLSSQNKIAKILSDFDDLIENNDEQITLLEKIVQLIYHEWFVKYLFPGFEDVLMVDSKNDFGMIPKGWDVKQLKEIIDIIKGFSYRSDNLVNNGSIAFINLKCLNRGGGFRYDGIKRFEGDYKKRHLVKTGDIILAVTDMTQNREIIARAARIPELNEEKIIFSMDLVKIVPKEGINKIWLYSFFNFSKFGEIMKEFANGVNVLHLKSEPILDYEILIPPKRIIEEYSKITGLIFNEIDNLHLKNKILESIRDLLLPKLISGQINVTNMEIRINEEEKDV